ncbi:hypothetical protein K1719_011164 [Acacia pycnantha]|nr:hypothetical protein K1719_011164 [Acacia pycnantha]
MWPLFLPTYHFHVKAVNMFECSFGLETLLSSVFKDFQLKLILKELKDLQKDAPSSCSVGELPDPLLIFLFGSIDFHD